MLLQSVLTNFTRKVLLKILKKCNDEEYRTSWKKDQLVAQVLSYSTESILSSCTVNELKILLEALSLPKTGNKKTLCTRLQTALTSKPTESETASRKSPKPSKDTKYRIPVFYHKKQSVPLEETESTQEESLQSPSATKPQYIIKEWLEKYKEHIDIHPSSPINKNDFYLAHDQQFVDQTLSGQINNGFGNRSKKVAKSLPYTTGSYFSAALHVLKHGGVAVSPTSGFHHAHFYKSGGYCTFNGLMVTAIKLHKEQNIQKIGILDLDEHYGDGTQNIIKNRKIKYITHYTYGGNEYDEEEDFLKDLPKQLKAMKKAKVEIILAQFGADPHKNDPLSCLGLSTQTMRKRDRLVLDFCKKHKIPLVWNFAGGYQEDRSAIYQLHHNSLEETIAVFCT